MRATTVFLVLVFNLYSAINGFSQFTIIGTVKDSVSNQPIEYCQMGLMNAKTNQLIDISTTNAVGSYKLIAPTSGYFKITINSLTHGNIERDVLLSSNNLKEIKIDFLLAAKTFNLNGMTIKAKLPPILVKGDTIIYHLEKWTHKSDENLEDVLQKMPGFEVLQDGEIKINGKQINKILINGEEVLDAGAALTTRSIAPDMIKNIEVRMKEKDQKFKESLLSKNDLVVLDIKLKDELNTSFFGKSRVGSGLQKKPLGSAYANFFSLKKRNKTHLLSEYDQFGTRTISLSQLKDIDREAYMSMFDLPADFKGLTEREEYGKEIYGFRDYTKSQPGSISVANRFTPNDKLDIYLVSFNSWIKERIENNTRQEVFRNGQSDLYVFDEDKSNQNWISKNRMEIKYNIKDKLRVEYNLLYSHQENANQQSNIAAQTGKTYLYNGNLNTSGLLHNFKAEYKLTKTIGLHLSNLLENQQNNQLNTLFHNDSVYLKLFRDDRGNPLYKLSQQLVKHTQQFATNIYAQFDLKKSNINVGIRIFNQNLQMNKIASSSDNREEMIRNSIFSAQSPTLSFQQYVPYLEYNMQIGVFNWRNRIGVGYLNYPDQLGNKNNTALLDYSTNFDFNFGSFDHLGILWRQNLSSFSLQKLAPGADLINFQTIAIPGLHTLNPQVERVAQVSYSSSLLKDLGVGIVTAGIYGTNHNSDGFGFSSAPFIGIEYNQLHSSYVVGNMIITKVFNYFPLSIKLEPSIIKNWQENLGYNGENYNTATRIFMTKLSLRSTFENKPYDFSLSTQYQAFLFRNGIAAQSPVQKYISTQFSASYSFLDEVLLLHLKLKDTYFTGVQSANYFNIFLRAQYKKGRSSLFCEVDNLLNNRYFYKREITPSYQLDTRRLTFSRYFSLGFEFRFR